MFSVVMKFFSFEYFLLAIQDYRLSYVFLVLLDDLLMICSFACFKDYYKVLEVEYDASDEKIRLNYRKLALVSHPYFIEQHLLQLYF